MKIEIESYNMEIRTLSDGKEVAQIKPSVAFNEEFIAQVRAAGVKDFKPREDVPQE